MHGSGATKLITENEDMNDTMKIIEALESSGILLKGVSKTIENETKEQKGGFLSMLLGTLEASLLGNLLSGGKGIVYAGEGATKGTGIVRAGERAKKKQKFNLMPPYPLTNFKISEYYKNEPRFNGVYSRDNLPKTSAVKKGAYVINLDECTHWIALYVKTNQVIYSDSFGVETFLKKLKNLSVIKTLKQIYLGYRHMIRLRVVIFVLSLLTICLMVKV